jgi:ribosomal protein S17
MKKVATMLVIVILASLGALAVLGLAQEKKEAGTGTCPPGQIRWHGSIMVSNKVDKTIVVRRRGEEIARVLHYTDDTKWTTMNKPAEMSDIKEGDDVITCSEAKEKGKLYLTRVDKRVHVVAGP